MKIFIIFLFCYSLIEKVKYQRLPNEMVNKSSSIKILQKMKKLKLLWSCLELCENSDQCHYSEYHDSSQECNLYDKKAHLMPSNKSIQVVLYKRKIYSPKEIQGDQVRDKIDHLKYTRYNKTQISGLYLSLDVESEETCLKECISRKNVCIAISFGENRCHLVKKGTYQHRRFNNWISIYLENVAPIKLENKNTNYSVKRLKILIIYFYILYLFHLSRMFFI